MTPDYLCAKHIIEKHLPDVTTRSSTLAAAVGFALSRCAALPSSPVEDASNYYNLTVSPVVHDRVSAVNEQLIIPVTDTLHWARAFWHIRYATAHQPRNWIPALESVNFFDSFTLADIYLSREQFDLLNGKRDAIFAIANELVCIFQGE